MTAPLACDDFGEVVRGRMFQACTVGPCTDGDGWSAYALYKDHIVPRDPWTIYEINLQTQAVKAFAGQQCDTWWLVAMPDGCIYTFPEDHRNIRDQKSPERKAYVARVNTRSGELEIFGPGSPDAWNYRQSWGPDWAMYISGWHLHHAMRFDPDTGKFVDYGPQGPPCVGMYSVAADETHVYTTMGQDPCYLVACHKDTRKQDVLFERPVPHKILLNRRRDGVYVTVLEMTGSGTETPPLEREFFRLQSSELTALESLPVLPHEPPPVSPAGVVRPEILPDSVQSKPDGTATLWYRPHESEWESVTFEAGPSASHIFRLGTFGDGKIVGSSEDPYHLFQIDPDTGDKRVLGPPPYNSHIYTFAGANGKGYFTGYSQAPLFEWDPDREWTEHPPTPHRPPPVPNAPEANPRLLLRPRDQHRAYRMVRAADGRLYILCSANIALMAGGMLAWYDPTTGEYGDTRVGFETRRGHECTLAGEGRYVAAVVVPWPPEQTDPAGVVVYDTRERRVILDVVPIPGGRDTGQICEWHDGILIGRMDVNEYEPQGPWETRFYQVDIASGTTSAGPQLKEKHHGILLRLPDGRVGSTRDNVIVAVDPTDWQMEDVGALPSAPRDWMMLGRDLVFACDTRVCRIREFLS